MSQATGAEPGPLDAPVTWTECAEEGCRGVVVPSLAVCLAHTGASDLDAVIAAMFDAETIDLRGIRIADDLLERIVEAAPIVRQRPMLPHIALDEAVVERRISFGEAWYNGAVFRGVASFRGTRFARRAAFIGAQFLGPANFKDCVFEEDAQFDGGATFHHNADFSGVRVGRWLSLTAHGVGVLLFRRANLHDVDITGRFTGPVSFAEAQCTGRFAIRDATFECGLDLHEVAVDRSLSFDKARVRGLTPETIMMQFTMSIGTTTPQHVQPDAPALRLDRATCRGDLHLSDAAVEGWADLHHVTLAGTGALSGLTVTGDLDLRFARFDGAQLGAVAVGGEVRLDDAAFLTRLDAALDAGSVTARSTRFAAGGRLQVRRADVWLDRASIPAPFLLTALEAKEPPVPATITPVPPPDSDAAEVGTDGDAEEAAADGRPGFVWPEPAGPPRLRSIHNADVSALTIGALDLQTCVLTRAQNLDKLHLESLDLLPQAHSLAGRRRALAEELALRERIAGNQTHRAVIAAEAHAIAATYRSLRKGLEDAKNEPGAADLYYGEMEMRRLAARRLSTEWWILHLYWLSSGYALRASRSLGLLVVTLLTGGILLRLVGFTQPVSITEALLYGAGVSISLDIGGAYHLTQWGDTIRIGLKLAGPLFLGLSLLSLRGRVKR